MLLVITSACASGKINRQNNPRQRFPLPRSRVCLIFRLSADRAVLIVVGIARAATARLLTVPNLFPAADGTLKTKEEQNVADIDEGNH